MNVDIFKTDKKYRTIYMDPPWAEQGGGKIKRGADRHYSLMKTQDIAKLPIKELAHPDGCHVYMWVTNNFLEDGLWLLKQWGFEYVTMITWVKDKQGLGQYYRGMSESCLFATTKKRLPYKLDENGKRCQGVTAFFEERREHSRKPVKMREMIERVSYGDRIELFAREAFPGWDCWGNEAPEDKEVKD